MVAAYFSRDAKSVSQKLLGGLVHRSRILSREGVLERLFTLAFSGLVYPQIWEDPLVDMEAMEIEPNHHIVAIASGGCNVLSYLIANPASITAVDLNQAHVALLRLKLAGLRHLPAWECFYRFFGEADDRQNERAYEEHLRSELDAETRKYWEGRTLAGRRRLSHFSRNIYRKGLLGRFIGASHLLARAYGCEVSGLLRARSLDEQREFFANTLAPLFERKLVRWVTDHRLSLYGLGVPPAQYEGLSGGTRMSDVLRERLERLACQFPLSENYFAWQAFGRSYAPGGLGPLPPYLQKQNFLTLKNRADRVDVRQTSFTDAVDAMRPGSVHRFVLLDAQDWMNHEQLNMLWEAITRAAAPCARVVFRTAAKQADLSALVSANVLGGWRYLEQRSTELGRRDRSSVYGGFHIYERGGLT
jgi:S-adenosylmethionine-diacylglycerol 3-amino-3-carboxypropyl transferase